MDVKIQPSTLSGRLTPPPSKSAAHRAAICAALAHGISRLSPIEATNDMLATINAVKTLGTSAAFADDGTLVISAVGNHPASAVIDCGESGSTLRFMVPVAAALGISASFRGHGRLPERPMDELVQVMETHGIIFEKKDNEILSCSGKLTPGRFEIAGNVSSQYITGLLLALPLLDGDSELTLTSPLESRAYVDITVDIQNKFGVNITETATGYRVAGNQRYKPQIFTVEGDYSSAAFWLCAGALGGNVEISGLNFSSKQGDRRIMELLKDLGANIKYGRDFVSLSEYECKGFDVDVSQIPDLMPILAVAAVYSNGVSRLYNARRLRLKESDRIAAVAQGLRGLGAGVIEHPEELIIIGHGWLFGGGKIDSFGDHRIAMSMSIAASYARNPSVILGAESVDKSYPGFYKDFAVLGGMYDVL